MEKWTEEELEELEKIKRTWREMYKNDAPSNKLGLSFEEYLIITLTILRNAYVELIEQMEE